MNTLGRIEVKLEELKEEIDARIKELEEERTINRAEISAFHSAWAYIDYMQRELLEQ